MAVRQVPASQLHHLVDSGEHIHIEHGESPRKKFAVLWPLATPLETKNGVVVGDHYMFDGQHWYVGTRRELEAALAAP